MREMDGEALIYEALLKLYYDKNSKRFLDGELKRVMDSFVEYCKAKDIVENTKIAEIMAIVFDLNNSKSKCELKDTLAFSDSSLYRFRIRLIRSLQKYIEERLK